MTQNKINNLIKGITKVRNLLTDEQAIQVKELFPEWKDNTEYNINERVVYKDNLYKTIISHISNIENTPDIAGEFIEL